MIKHFLAEKIYNLLNEFGYILSDVESFITTQYEALLKHLVATLHFRDPYLTSEWTKSVFDIFNTMEHRIRKSKIKIDRNKLEQWIPSKDWDDDIERMISILEFKYDIRPQSDEYCTKIMTKKFLDKIYDALVSKDSYKKIIEIVKELRDVVDNHEYDC